MGSGSTAGTPAEVTPPPREHPNIPAKGEPYRVLVIAFVDHEYKGDGLIWSEWVADPDTNPGEDAQLWVAYDPEVCPRSMVDYFINRWYGKPSVVVEVEL